MHDLIYICIFLNWLLYLKSKIGHLFFYIYKSTILIYLIADLL